MDDVGDRPWRPLRGFGTNGIVKDIPKAINLSREAAGLGCEAEKSAAV